MDRKVKPPTACAIWLSVDQQFFGYKGSHTLIPYAEFCTFVQGDLLIDDYCHHLKTMVDKLVALSDPFWDHMLILNILRGLNDRFAYMAALIQRKASFAAITKHSATSCS